LDFRRQIGLATSADGIHWTKSSANPVLSNGQPGDFDSEHVHYGPVLFHNNQYWFWYSGHNGQHWQIGLAASSDGIHWTKHPDNPVLTVGNTGEWDAYSVISPAVIFDGQSFKMWYNGNGSQFVQAAGYAESLDGVHWTKYPHNPILSPVPNTWESDAVGMGPVLFFDGKYHAWYGGRPSGVRSSIGYATSADGIVWERYAGNPVVEPGGNGAWDSTTLGGFWVLRENGALKMWYSGRSDDIWKIGYAESKEDSQDNYALSFDGGDDIVGLPPNFISTPAAITMEAWVKYSSSQPLMMVLTIETYAFFLNRFGVGTFTPFFDGSTNNGNDLGYGANLNDNQWHHLAAVHAQGVLKVFVDGVLVGSVNESLYDINSLNRASAIGAQFDGSEFHYDGLVDEVRVWNIARTAGEIQADMHRQLAGNETGLIGYWRCDEGTGQILHDASPSGAHGQLGFSPQGDAADPQWVLANRLTTGCQGIPLPASEAYGDINGGDRSHRDKVTYCFAGQADDWYLSFQAFDIDTDQEVAILLNGVKIFDVPITANNSWSGLLGVLLPDELINDQDDNELVFDKIGNSPQWGVRQVSVDPFFALPSAAAYGKIQGGDQDHADKVVYFFSGRPGDLSLIYEVYDIDNVNELDILLNGAKIHDETPAVNNGWSAPRSLPLPDALVNDAGLNVVIFDSPSNPPNQWPWGVRNVRVNAAPQASLALELSRSIIAEAYMAQDGQYLFDGRRTPPARLETDDDTVIDGATTIAPNGHLVVDLLTVQQFDYLQLYPEWNAQRYFSYRIEASQNGKDWQTVIDKSASFVHGIQLDELPVTQARFLRIRGASFMADVDALPTAGLSEETYWQLHDEVINRAASTDLAIAELALFQKQSRVNVASEPNSPPAFYDLDQNFPNPFNPVTTIKFALPRSAKVKLAVYNLRGELVRTLVEGELPAGFHARTFDTAGLASGIYLYQLQAGDFTVTRKMVLAK
jgi:hypothetical protein